ncbi:MULTISPECIES: hypothetical protein [Methylobacterium]|uniref:hypothetical protein n=1 Tax=Methylobacterium TaxID=407 RepID=UPI00272ED73F|nr:hypothetical protein [Methylobacterium sp.]
MWPQGDKRPILMRPCRTDEINSDKSDILDMVRKRIKERGIEPNEIRQAGVSKWSPGAHWRLKEGCFDNAISIERAYQLAIAVGLKRTKALPFSP